MWGIAIRHQDRVGQGYLDGSVGRAWSQGHEFKPYVGGRREESRAEDGLSPLDLVSYLYSSILLCARSCHGYCLCLWRTYPPPTLTFIFHHSPSYTLCSSQMQTFADPYISAHTWWTSCFPHTIPSVDCLSPPIVWVSCHPPVFLKH